VTGGAHCGFVGAVIAYTVFVAVSLATSTPRRTPVTCRSCHASECSCDAPAAWFDRSTTRSLADVLLSTARYRRCYLRMVTLGAIIHLD